MTANSLSHTEQAAHPSWVASVVEQQLRSEFPTYAWITALAASNDGLRKTQQQFTTQRDSRRAVLLALPLSELEALRSRQTARAEQEARERDERAIAKAAKKEAAKFYNQPHAIADFDHWGKMEYWTFDEALALLFGKNPEVLTPSAMRREVASGLSLLLPGYLPEKSAFVSAYESLRHLAERATPMQGARLSPTMVLQWAHRSAGLELPAPLLKAVLEQAKQTQPDIEAARSVPAAGSDAPTTAGAAAATKEDTPVLLKRSAFVAQHYRNWPSIESDLNHCNENGLSARAKADKHGYWREADALEWARENGKLKETAHPLGAGSSFAFGNVHRAKS